MNLAFDVGALRSHPAGVGLYVRSLAQALHDLPHPGLSFIGLRPDTLGLPSDISSIGRSAKLPYSAWVELLAERDAGRSGAHLAHFTDGLVPIIRRRRTVLTVHDLSLVRQWRSHRWVRYPRIPLVMLSPRLADRVVADSRATADEVMALTGTPANKIDVIGLAARASARPRSRDAVADVRARFGLSTEGFLLVPGTLEPRKNHRRVIAAFELLMRRSSAARDLQLVLAGGSGWGAGRIEQVIASSPSRDRIRVLGYVTDDDLAALMTGSEAVIYASLYEGFGLPVVEAMACGAPVVTSNLSSMPEVAGDAAILVNPYDIASVARGIELALHSDASVRAGSIAQAGRFSWARTARATAEVYEALA